MTKNYKKKTEKFRITLKEFSQICVSTTKFVLLSKKLILPIVAAMIILPVVAILVFHHGVKESTVEEISINELTNMPIAATVSSKSVINIPKGIVKANPFVPYREISGSQKVKDVPAFELVAPPEVLDENSDAARVMDTIVSGILYDKYSPSAIINIEGNDYLVKKGDVVNNYKVLDIMQDSVTVQLGKNVYKAGIGEILTEGTLNHNVVSNLNNKFGGEK